MAQVLTPRTKQHLNALFAAADRTAAEATLLGWSEDSERLRFAALRFSGGNLTALQNAIELGKLDWRDLLVAAGFADDVTAHERWDPTQE